MSTLKVNAIKNTSDVEMYLCKAWVNFNGTGTVAIRGSGNVTSVTDNGTGDYTVNFTTAMPAGNYSTAACASRLYAGSSINEANRGVSVVTQNTGSFVVNTFTQQTATLYDPVMVSIAVFS